MYASAPRWTPEADALLTKLGWPLSHEQVEELFPGRRFSSVRRHAKEIGLIDKTGVIRKIVQFFENNPDEELLPMDIVEKFGVPYHTAKVRLSEAKRQGLIEVVTVIRRKKQPVRQEA